MSNIQRIIVTGAVGQIGSELTLALRERYGADNVIAGGHRTEPSPKLKESGPFVWCDVVNREELMNTVKDYKIDTIINMSAILSAKGEENPQACWNVNLNGLINCLEVARELELKQVLCPSSIAVFGPTTPKDNTPQETILKPTTMYGVTKVAGELLCDYYVKRYGVDARGLRYPGIISSETLPGGGTTDYAVWIFYKAIEEGKYSCFLKEDTMLPMMYMPDCIKATMDLMEAPIEKLRYHGDYNISAFSFTPAELANEIKKRIPNFEMSYEIDPLRQAIADSWPRSIDDTPAREDWSWKPAYDLGAMVDDMLEKLRTRHEEGRLYG